MLGDVRRPVTLCAPSAEVEDPASETYSRTFTETNVLAYVASYNQREIDNVNIKVGDRKVISIAPEALQVRTEWRVKIDGETWNVINFTRDPTGLQTTIQVRR